MSEQREAPALPWAGWPDEIGCNFAAGHLSRNLSQPLIDKNGRLHAETLTCAAGAVAGWGAHRSLMRDPATARLAGQMHIATLNDGREMLYGDAINNRLMSNDRATAPACVWNNLAGTAIGHGLAQEELPDIEAMFASVTQRMGGPLEGLPSTDLQPHAPAAVLLERVLPVTLACLTGEISEITKKQNFHAAETSYQIVTAWTAANILGRCCEVMPPKTALIIGMESAIYASKLTKPFHT
jgi:hypothetical protein